MVAGEQNRLLTLKKKKKEVPMNEIKVITLSTESAVVRKKIVDLNFPPSTNIISIKRKGRYMQPTVLTPSKQAIVS
jgi:Trk K+ transport system NAD-binding subunit